MIVCSLDVYAFTSFNWSPKKKISHIGIQKNKLNCCKNYNDILKTKKICGYSFCFLNDTAIVQL